MQYLHTTTTAATTKGKGIMVKVLEDIEREVLLNLKSLCVPGCQRDISALSHQQLRVLN